MKISIEYEDESVRSLLQKLQEKLEDTENTKLIVGTSVSYAYEHQTGDGQRKREFLGVSETDRLVLQSILEESILDPASNYRSTLQEMGEYLLLSTDQRWEAEEAPDGTPWAKNAPWVIERKKRLGKIQKILQETGRLRSSIAYRID
jgi:phage gpG-like protein